MIYGCGVGGASSRLVSADQFYEVYHLLLCMESLQTAVGRSSELYTNRMCLAKFDQSGRDGECLELVQVVMTSSGI